MHMTSELYKISVCVPSEFVNEFTESLDGALRPLTPYYDRTFILTEVTGTWRSLEGSNPYNGKIGDTTYAKEIKVEFPVMKDDLVKTIRRIKEIHPYEEPAIDVICVMDWKRVIGL